MIPIKLVITGFLSYQGPVELDFTSFDLACISGSNGAGKSSLLDAFTWVLFGQARKRDDSLINLQSTAAVVQLTFQYENNTYRVTRTLPKGKTSQLEFQIQQPEDGKWKTLTGHTLRDTQAQIEHTLRLDYETFVNASFFLQGKADQFTQQKPGDRKRILGSILGLEQWEVYQKRANRRRKGIEVEINTLEGRLQEINTELNEEDARTGRLSALQAELKRLVKVRKAQEQQLEQARKVDATLGEQRKLVSMLGRQLEISRQGLDDLGMRIQSREKERAALADRVARAKETESAYAALQGLRKELQAWDEVAERFREHDARRQAPLLEIETRRGRLNQELEGLVTAEKTIQSQALARAGFEAQAQVTQSALQRAEQALGQKAELDEALQAARQRQADARAENPRLKDEMDSLKARLDQLSQTEGAVCPLCGRPLETHDRLELIEEISAQGKEMGDRYRANLAYLKEADQKVIDFEARIAALSRAEADQLAATQTISRLNSQVETIQHQAEEWSRLGLLRKSEVQSVLASESFAMEARQVLAAIDGDLKAIGYDAAAHYECKKREAAARPAEEEYQQLVAARAALQPMERELKEAQAQQTKQAAEVTHLQQEYDEANARLAAAQAEAPDLDATETALHDLLEQENNKTLEVGAAQQKVMVLKDLKVRLKDFSVQREELARRVSQFKLLERAFGKDGVPALLIEQALPEIETRANELLDRLSEGNMSIRFASQAAFKDKKRDDLKETLDIRISDGAGTRDYELYSGGEAFRVDFAIRLALSELLARRAGARLQTLVIDEGFGSQDAMGRQHLIEAINQVRPDFAKILVITHIEELKEAFPNRIEVEKSERGSQVKVV